MTEKRKEYLKQWRKDNPEKIREQHQQYYQDHKVKENERTRQWRINNPEYKKQWHECNPERVKAFKTKEKAKRRNLGFILLNRPFEGCEGHHISENFVIYIPKKLHKSIYHNIWNWKNMDKINQLAIECL